MEENTEGEEIIDAKLENSREIIPVFISKNSDCAQLHQPSVSESLDSKKKAVISTSDGTPDDKEREKDPLSPTGMSEMIIVLKSIFAGRPQEEGRLENAVSFDLDVIQELIVQMDKKDAFCSQTISKFWKSAFESLHSLLNRSKILLLNLQQGIQGCEYGRDFYPITIEHKVISRYIGNANGGCLIAFAGDIICYEDSNEFFRICNPKTKECFLLPFPEGGPHDMCFAFGFIERGEGRTGILTVGKMSADASIKCSIFHMFTGHRDDILQLMFWKDVTQHCPVVIRGTGVVVNEGIYWLADLDTEPKNAVVLFHYDTETFHIMEGPAGWEDNDHCGLAGNKGKVVFTTCTKKEIKVWEWNGSSWIKLLVMDAKDQEFGEFKVLPRNSDGFLIFEHYLQNRLKEFYLLDVKEGRLGLILEQKFPLNFEIGFCQESYIGFVGWEDL